MQAVQPIRLTDLRGLFSVAPEISTWVRVEVMRPRRSRGRVVFTPERHLVVPREEAEEIILGLWRSGLHVRCARSSDPRGRSPGSVRKRPRARRRRARRTSQ